MKYNASVNIEIGVQEDFQYIVTPNVQRVLGDIVSSVSSGVHSFSIIGTYGTGKSSFIMALENGLKNNDDSLLKEKRVFFGLDSFKILNVVGEYDSLQGLLARRLRVDNRNVLDSLKEYCKEAESKDKAVVIVIDEFGKVLEHAAKNSPEEELYFIQQLCELINDHRRKAILITTLHQNFSSYASKLSDYQRNEWQKVKGRFKEVVFSEPVEQLLYLAAEQLNLSPEQKADNSDFARTYQIAKRCRFISDSFSEETSNKLNPIDPLAATCLTLAIQKYGQNERSLFSFLTTTGQYSVLNFDKKLHQTYNLADVYDYSLYNFYSEISQVNLESSGWSAIKVALGRIESGIIKDEYILDAQKIVKAIGLLSIFGSSETSLDREALEEYCACALGITNAGEIIRELERVKIIRYATYKSQYILFEGTDINIEAELLRAATMVPTPSATVDELRDYIRPRIESASAAYYLKGTPRYFSFIVLNEPETKVPEGDIDGICELIFPLEGTCLDQVKSLSASCEEAILFAVFNNVSDIVKHLHEIKKLQYIAEKVAIDDQVARREIANIQAFEKNCLNSALNDYLFDGSGNVTWVFRGKECQVRSKKDFNKLLSSVCAEVYSKTPIVQNELFNKQKLSSAISLAKSNLIDRILEHPGEVDLGFKDGEFPPEKTIYLTLLKNTGIHRKDEDGAFVFGAPTNAGIRDFWEACESFIAKTIDRPRKVSDLIKMLQTRPFKLKQGFIDFWIPIFLYIKQQDFAMYGANGAYIMSVNREVLDLLWKRPGDFTLKAFSVGGVKLEFFRKYRQFLKADDEIALKKDSFANTFKPFLIFYKKLNDYAKSTYKFSSPNVAKFRDVLANAVDPEKVFFEQLPESLGYRGDELQDDFIKDYLDKIRAAILELNACYPELITRIESRLIEKLGLPADYESYKSILDSRYSHVKKHLLPQKTRSFLDRVLAPAETNKEFIERIASVVLDKQLYKLKDKEEEALLDNIIFLFYELDRYIGISEVSEDSSGDTLFSFGLSSTNGVNEHQKTYRLPKPKQPLVNQKKQEIERILSGDPNIDVCILLDLLADKINN